jgi:hypothetical protein
MRKIVKSKPLTREQLANPYSPSTINTRLVQKGAVDLRDNCIVRDLGNGYITRLPIDKNKKLK